jgi:hypothetical protein
VVVVVSKRTRLGISKQAARRPRMFPCVIFVNIIPLQLRTCILVHTKGCDCSNSELSQPSKVYCGRLSALFVKDLKNKNRNRDKHQ